MTVKLAINGFGRIGRYTLAQIAESARNNVQVVRINATGPIETNAHLLRYGSVQGRFAGEVRPGGWRAPRSGCRSRMSRRSI